MDRSVIFITGAASGIGRATAKLFSARGWFVGATDVNEADLLALEQELSAECFTAQLDVTNKPQFDDVMTRFSHVVSGRLDLLFNNAGIAKFGFLEDLPYEEIMATINVNFVGVLNGVTAAIPLLKATPNSLCFTTASSAANFGTPGLAVYGATKSAVKHLTESLSVELARHGSRAADVSPGIIDTPLWNATRYVKDGAKKARNMAEANVDRTDAARTIQPEEVAQCVWDAYTSDKMHWYVPVEIEQRNREAAIAPERLRDEMIASSTR